MQENIARWQSVLVSVATEACTGDGAHDINHLHRVWNVAAQLLNDYPQADALVVLAACYLHDIVNLPKNHPDRASASCLAARMACEKLEAAAFPAEKVKGVAHAIEAHSFSAGIVPVTIEAKIVQDADRLDALGAVGLARLFYTAGRLGSALAHPDDPLAEKRPMNDRMFALDHIECKLATLPATMQTAAGRRLGEARLSWLRSYRDTFIEEWGAGRQHDQMPRT